MLISDWSSDVCSSELRFFGATITASTGRVVPVRLIGEQHVREDLGFIPSFADWVRCIRPEPWMGRAQPIHRSVDPFAITADDPDRRPERPNLRVIGASSCARSEAPTSELQSLMRISTAVFCSQTKNTP